jgi:hypothetical protein
MHHTEDLMDFPLTILFVHLGTSDLPSHIFDTVRSTSIVAPASKISIIVNHSHTKLLNDFIVNENLNTRNISVLAREAIPISEDTKTFHDTSRLDKNFRNGFWFHASERFYLIADYLEFIDCANCLHLENDVQLYMDPSKFVHTLNSFSSLAVPLDRVRAIPGVVWFKDPSAARMLAHYMLQHHDQDDMVSLGQFCNDRPKHSRPLPSMPLSYARDKSLDIDRYTQGVAEFKGIFDCAAIGQYLDGGHYLNHPEDTRFFLNECSDLNMTDFDFNWNVQDGLRQPCISYSKERTPILAIHVHSKNMRGFSPTNTGVSDHPDEVITIERLQAICDLTISSSQVTAFHGRDKIKSRQFIELPEKIEGGFFKKTKTIIPPGEDFLNICRTARTIFVYAELLDYFQIYVAPRLSRDFVLMTNNIGQPLKHNRLPLLNHPNLKALFLQNTELQHHKIVPLPVGITNNRSDEQCVSTLFRESNNIRKSKALYSSIRSTGSHSAHEALMQAQQLSGHYNFSGLSFETHIKNLADHKFCLCPTGEMQNPNIFWEAQYTDCIPIIIKSDWSGAYSNLPLLVLDSWKDLPNTNLDQEYVRITTTAFDRTTLRMTYYRNLISEFINK